MFDRIDERPLLVDLVSAEIRQLVVPRTPVQLALVTGKPVRSGALHLPDVPGNGLEWDEDAVAHYRAEP